MKVLKIISVVALAVLVVSCCPCRKNKSKSMATLSGTKWQLTQVDSRSVSPSADSFTVEFTADGKVAGKGDCNRLAGSYTLKEGAKIELSPLVSTRMFCANQADEDKFMKAFQGVDNYRMDGNMLMLFSGQDLKMILNKQ